MLPRIWHSPNPFTILPQNPCRILFTRCNKVAYGLRMPRFIIRRRFSLILCQFSILCTILSIFLGFRVLVLGVCPMVLPMLFKELLTTFWHFFLTILTTFWHFFDNFDNFFKVFWQRLKTFYNFFWQLWQLFESFLTTFLKFFGNILTTLTIFWKFFDNFWQFLTIFWHF
jgi:hypothetical protein